MNQKIMLIDDSLDMRVLMRILLESEGYLVEEAVDGKQALKRIVTESVPDLIFLDYNMPNMNGPQFIAAFKKKLPKIFSKVPVIMSTGLEAEDAADAFATEVVNKQRCVEDLVKLARKYLKKSK